MGGGKKSKKDGDRKSRKKGRDTPVVVSREASDDEAFNDEASNGPDMVPTAAKVDVEDIGTVEDEFGAKDFRSEMEMRPDHESRPLWVAPVSVSCDFH